MAMIIYGTTSNKNIDAKIEYSCTQDIANNKSTVEATLYYKRNDKGYTTYGQGSFTISIGGKSTALSRYMHISNAWVGAGSATETITHDTDGTKYITVSASGSIPGTTLSSTSCSAGMSLITIPRASTIASVTDKKLGSACEVKWTPLSKSFRYKLQFTLGSYLYTTGPIHPNTTSSYTYTGYDLPLDVANQLPSDKTGTMKVVLYTYSDSDAKTQVGSSSSKTFTVTVPDNESTKPVVTMTLAPVHSLGAAFNSVYVQGKSKVQATLSAQGKYSASVSSSSYSMEALGKTDKSSPYQSDYLPDSGLVTIKGYATDSRGYIGSISKNVTVIPYSKPQIVPASGESAIVCVRCDKDGNPIDSGTYLKVKAKRSYSEVTSSGVQKNFCRIRYRYREEGKSYSDWAVILDSTATSDEIETSALLGGTLLTTKSYTVQVGVIDDIGEENAVVVNIPTDRVYMDRAGSINSLGIGKYAEDPNTIDVAADLTVRVRGGFKGVEIPGFADLNTLQKPNLYYGRYSYTPYYVNCPIKEEATFSLEVIPIGPDGQTLQRVTKCAAEATVYERQYYSSTWQEWECVNPPMEVDEEYRTKERYLGKPVYTKTINFGALPNATKKTVAHGASPTQVIRCVGQMSDGNSIPFHFSSTNWVEIYAGPQYVVALTGDNKSSATAYAQMWYTKD